VIARSLASSKNERLSEYLCVTAVTLGRICFGPARAVSRSVLFHAETSSRTAASTATQSLFAETARRTDEKVAQFCANSLSARYFGGQNEGANRPSNSFRCQVEILPCGSGYNPLQNDRQTLDRAGCHSAFDQPFRNLPIVRSTRELG